MTPRLHPDFLKIPLAHRALHDQTDGRPENSRAAIKAAINAGYGIEIDVQLSGDAQAMVFHDYRLERLAEGQGNVKDKTAVELGDTQLHGGHEGIPTLSEVLDLVAGKVPLLIEVKDQDGQMGPDIGPLEAQVAQCLQGYDGPVAVMSFNPHSVARMAELLPNVPRGLVTDNFDAGDWGLPEDVCARLRPIPDFERTQSSFISHDCRDLDAPRVHELKGQGADILCWTVKSPAQEAQARKTAQNITFEGYAAPFPA